MRLGADEPSVWGHLLWPLPPVVAQVGLRTQAQIVQAAGHHLLPGHWCQVQLVLPHWAGIITPQLIFQTRFVTAVFSISKQLRVKSRSCCYVSTSPQFSFLWCRDRAGARLAQVTLCPCGLTLEAVGLLQWTSDL